MDANMLSAILTIPFILCIFGFIFWTIKEAYKDSGFIYAFVIFSCWSAMFGMMFSCSSRGHAATFKYKNGLIIEAKTYKEASQKCFWHLTGNKYPGEERGMEIIDICANPIRGQVE